MCRVRGGGGGAGAADCYIKTLNSKVEVSVNLVKVFSNFRDHTN